MDTRICNVCGKVHEIYGGLHEPNMIDFRWKGFGHDSVSVYKYILCPECCAAVYKCVEDIHLKSMEGREKR